MHLVGGASRHTMSSQLYLLIVLLVVYLHFWVQIVSCIIKCNEQEVWIGNILWLEGQAKSWSQTFKVEKPVLLSTSCMSLRKSFNASELLKLPEKRYEQYLHYSVL